jgi:hypothetical protein
MADDVSSGVPSTVRGGCAENSSFPSRRIEAPSITRELRPAELAILREAVRPLVANAEGRENYLAVPRGLLTLLRRQARQLRCRLRLDV